MTKKRIRRRLATIDPALVLLVLLTAGLWIAGGASRADAIGQAVVRGLAAITMLIAISFFRFSPTRPALPVLGLLGGAIALVLLQLVPLPPGLWQSLPGRAAFVDRLGDENAVWRPLSLVPDATVNAAGALIVPLSVAVVILALRPSERRWLSTLLLALIAASTLVGLIEFSGQAVANPFVSPADPVAGTFANRNHFALFLALGCLITPVWALALHQKAVWRDASALLLVPLIVLGLLGSGSRAGLVLGVVGLIMGTLIARAGLAARTRRARRAILAGIAAGIILLGAFVLIIFVSGRADAINRVLQLGAENDLRWRVTGDLIALVQHYFPAGTGFGSFDPIFRQQERFELLQLTYLNHAHNDFIEVLLDGGLPASLLMAAAFIWWMIATWTVWRRGPTQEVLQGRLGSAIILLIALASAVDYPARTPLMMATLVLASLLLCWGASMSGTAPRQTAPIDA